MSKDGKNVVSIASREARLKKKFRKHLKDLGFRKSDDGLLQIEGSGKDVIRALHGVQRGERLKANADFIAGKADKLLKYFASGDEVDPKCISPVLERVATGTWRGDLFRLASLTWSVPVSHGFGRRLRYLVWDKHNGKLIGLIAIGDPVFNLAARDNLIDWDSRDRSARLVNVMDAYVLGAVPPYNFLLGGKMIACFLRSRDLYDDFARTYGATRGIISEKEKQARLLAITTSSSMGRSSVYNRLKLNGIQYLTPIGYTGGWGHFHIPDALFSELRAYLRAINHPYADLHCYGEGPNWRLRTTRAALVSLGMKDDMLRHGIQRQVFISFLASNAQAILRTGKGQPDLSTLLEVGQIADLARERWILPRSQRRPEFRKWSACNIMELLKTQTLSVGPHVREDQRDPGATVNE